MKTARRTGWVTTGVRVCAIGGRSASMKRGTGQSVWMGAMACRAGNLICCTALLLAAWGATARAELWTPASMTTAVWLAANDLDGDGTAEGLGEAGLSGTDVATWTDKSGNGRNATGTVRPTYTAGGPNGLYVVTFDGAVGGDILKTAWYLPNTYTIFTVAKKGVQTADTGSSLRPVLAATTTGARTMAGVGTFRTTPPAGWESALDFFAGVSRVTAIEYSWTNTESLLASCTHSGATLSGWKNGSPYSSPLSNADTGFGQVQIGGSDDYPARRFAGDIEEVIVLGGAASTNDRQKIEGYLAWKWGLEGKLPVGHPHKSAAPTVSDPNAPSIQNAPVTVVTTNSATFNGLLASTGSSACAVCVYWGADTNAWANTNWFEGTTWTNGSLLSTNRTLASDADYYYTFAASNATTNVVADSPQYLVTGEVGVEATASTAQYGGVPGQFTIRRPATATHGALTVAYTMSGSAGNGADYSLLSGSVTLAAGATTAVLAVTALCDPDTTNEEATLTLTPGGNYPIAASGLATVTIRPNAATMRLWDGGGATAYASNPTNWDGDTLPASDSTIVLNATTNKNMTWDGGSNGLPVTVAAWDQQAGYTGTVTFLTRYGASGFTNFTVAGDVMLGGGTWTHVANVGGEAYRLRMTVGGNLLLTNATIGANALGYTAGNGPGYMANCGGAYGGAAQGQDNVPNGGVFNLKIYGSIEAPTNLGSGGVNGGSGGGAIWLSVAGTTTVATACMITVNGGDGGGGASGGSGGSVYLTTGWLRGSGTIRANGGGSTWDKPAGGSGGRVALVLSGAGADFSSWTGANTAYGNNVAYPSAAGTVYRKTSAGADTLIINNGNIGTPAGRVPTLLPPAVNLNAFSSVVITNKGMLGIAGDTTFDFGTFAPLTYGPANSGIIVHGDTKVTYPNDWLIDGYTLYANNALATNRLVNVTIGTNGVLSHYQNYAADSYRLNLTLSGNLTILSNGLIGANALGYWKEYGSGYLVNYGSAHGGAAPAGADYGGARAVNRKTYGSVLAPTNCGSGGTVMPGGGAIVLTVGGTTTVAVAGAISANGGEQSNYGSSGGSVYLRTGWLTGGGTLRANGGRSDWDKGAGGGGGRVSIVLTGAGADFNAWTGSNTAYGGTTTQINAPAAAGTVYRQAAGIPAGAGTVLADNRNSATNASYTPLPAFSNATEIVGKTLWVSTNRARIGLVASTNVASLTLNANGALELGGLTLTVKELTVTNKVYRSGTYTAADIGLFTDGVGGGKVVVTGKGAGTVIVIR